MKKIAVLSDTHLLRSDDDSRLRRILAAHFADADMIFHAGDLVDIEAFSEIRAGRPFVCVSGNMDLPETKSEVPPKRVLQVEGVRIGLIHGDGFGGNPAEKLLSVFEDVSVIIFGHTHQPLCEARGDVLMLNPGSALHPCRGRKCTAAVLTVDGSAASAKIIDLD